MKKLAFSRQELSIMTLVKYLLPVLLLGLAACAGDVELVDRTQANKVKKAIFDPDGEWFFRPIVIDLQFNQGFLFEGYEGDLDRVRWRIEKDKLIGDAVKQANEELIGD